MLVLIIEDSDSICKMIEALLTGRGFSVRMASTGLRGLEEAFACAPDVVLLDINLPGSFDGIEVCRRLRADAKTAETPVVIISALNDDEIKRQAQEAGANAFYEKPFSPLALLKEIEALVKRSGRWRQEGTA